MDRSVEFIKFGYGPYKDKRCGICGKLPTRSEPRFGYYACIDCFDEYNPIEFSKGKYRENE